MTFSTILQSDLQINVQIYFSWEENLQLISILKVSLMLKYIANFNSIFLRIKIKPRSLAFQALINGPLQMSY